MKDRGITLIALVITIIVLIILAGVSINLLLGDNGLIKRAQNAEIVQEKIDLITEIQQRIFAEQIDKVPTQGALTQVDIETILGEYGTVNKNEEDGEVQSLTPTGKDYEIPYEEIVGNIQIGSGNTFIPTTLEEAKQDYVTQKTPVTDSLNNTVMIPNGFKVSSESGASIEEGIVVEDKKGNQFVWIPVELEDGETFESKYPRTAFADNAPTGSLGYSDGATSTTYTESYTNGYDGEDTEYEEMVASVNLNKGFYIGRYETGIDTEKETYTFYSEVPLQAQIDAEAAKLLIEKDAYVYNYVPWGANMDDITAYNEGTEESPKYIIGAVELAQNFDKVNNYSGVTSTLMYGIQWDMVMRYVADDEHDVTDSTSWGNYYDSKEEAEENSGELQTTGKNSAWQAKKVYDLAGNGLEWTMEACVKTYTEAPTTYSRVLRGRYI